MELDLIPQLGVALGLGLLVGLQREWSQSMTAGVRTFALLTLFGALSGVVADSTGSVWPIGVGVLSVAALCAIGNWLRIAGGDADPGLTTEVAMFVMFLVGAATTLGYEVAAVVVTGAVAVLLHLKQPLHRIVDRMGEDDFRAVVRLALIGMVILPILPDRSYGPYDVLNPFHIWLMVVLIVGISMAAYVAQRLLGERAGTLLGGVLGGLISSTATTVSYARQTVARPPGPHESAVAAVVIMIASATVFARVLVEIAVVAPTYFLPTALPLATMMLVMAIISAVAFVQVRTDRAATETDAPPSTLGAAVAFGALYAGVLLAAAFVKDHYGDAGMYVVAAVSGLTDMDAITLSSARLMNAETLSPSTAWRVILTGGMANLAFKLGAVALLGNRQLLARIAVMFAASLAGGAVLLWLWP